MSQQDRPDGIDGEQKKHKVLLVEDSLDDALLISAILESNGPFEVAHSQDGINGAERIRKGQFEILITDLNLPGKDGLELVKLSKELAPDRPVVVATGYASERYVDQAYRMGADGILQKPIDKDELVEVVQDLLGLTPERVAPHRTILAVGGRPGDVEFGIGGIISGHVERGHSVLLLVLAGGHKEPEYQDAYRKATEQAAQRLGVRLFVESHDATKVDDAGDGRALIRRLAAEFNPDTLYLPSAHHREASRRATHQVASEGGEDIPNAYGYLTAFGTFDFRPEVFVPVDDYIDRKAQALSSYGSGDHHPLYLDPELARCNARYWGQFSGYGLVEPLHVLRSS